MAKQARRPVDIPDGTKLALNGTILEISGPKGRVDLPMPDCIKPVIRDKSVLFEFTRGASAYKVERKHAGMLGLYRSLVKNRLHSVSVGVEKTLNVVGVGFQSEVKGKGLDLKVGFSHLVRVPIPDGITVKAEKNVITVSGFDPAAVGDFAARVRAVRPPEPYGGKGIRYADEYVRHKVGKAAGAGAGK